MRLRNGTMRTPGRYADPSESRATINGPDFTAYLARVRAEVAVDVGELLEAQLDPEIMSMVARATDTLAMTQLELLTLPDEADRTAIEQRIGDATSTLASIEAIRSIDIAKRVADTTARIWAEVRDILITAAIAAIA